MEVAPLDAGDDGVYIDLGRDAGGCVPGGLALLGEEGEGLGLRLLGLPLGGVPRPTDEEEARREAARGETPREEEVLDGASPESLGEAATAAEALALFGGSAGAFLAG